MTGHKPRILRNVGIVAALILIVAISSHNEGFAQEPGLGAEFEAIGHDVGWGGLASRIRHIPTDVVLVLIPPGDFTMGSPESEVQRDRDEVQRHMVIESAFYLGETEVTTPQWMRVMESLPPEHEHTTDHDVPHGTLPIHGVSWHKANEFVTMLNAQSVGSWRLPTEAEWEYACRAGTTTPFSFGGNVTPSQVNYDGQRPYADGAPGLRRDEPVPVRSLPPNPWGLYEMHGNVWEWCEDVYKVHPELDVHTELGSGADSPGASRVLRGGAWTSKGKQVRSANRDGYSPSSSGPKYGFRLVVWVGP